MLLGRILDTFGVSTVLDVGANEGGFAEELRASGFGGRIVSFEPASEPYALLGEKIARRGDLLWERHQLALGDEDGTGGLHVYSQQQFNSLHTPSPFGRSNHGELSETAPVESVELRRLDGLWEPLSLGSGVFLKVDTQGHDMKVLAGVGRRVSDVCAIQVELAVHAIYDDVPPLHVGLEQLQALGFRPVGFFPIGRHADGIRVTEFDVLLVRDAGAA